MSIPKFNAGSLVCALGAVKMQELAQQQTNCAGEGGCLEVWHHLAQFSVISRRRLNRKCLISHCVFLRQPIATTSSSENPAAQLPLIQKNR